jgi:hypothetical protein
LVGYYQHLIKGHANFNQFLKFYVLFLDELDIFNHMTIKHIIYVRIIYTVVCTTLQFIIEKNRFGHF